MTAKNRATLNSDATTNLANNTSGDISPGDVRTIIRDLADSMLNPLDDGNPFPGIRNALANGAMSISQRGTSFTNSTSPANNDDTYLLDRWTLLSEANNTVTVSQDAADVPANALHACRMVVSTANNKFGIIQFIEQRDCVGLLGNTVTLSFSAKDSAGISDVRAAIIAWDGTADVLTSDVVSSWGAAGTNPTLAANWFYENTPANLNVTTSWARYSVSAVLDQANTKNIAVLIWSDDKTTTITTDFLAVTNVQLEIGAVATAFERRSAGVELARCHRFYFRTTDLVTGSRAGVGQCASSTSAQALVAFPAPMRVPPSALEQSGTATDYTVSISGGTNVACSAVPAHLVASATSAVVTLTVASGLTAGDAMIFRSANPNGFLGWSAEL